MALCPGRSWAVIDGHLLLTCNVTRESARPVSTDKIGMRLGQCFEFNSKGFCSRVNCRYLHTCMSCFGHHPSCLCQPIPQQNPAFGHFDPWIPRQSPFQRPSPSLNMNSFYPGNIFFISATAKSAISHSTKFSLQKVKCGPLVNLQSMSRHFNKFFQKLIITILSF